LTYMYTDEAQEIVAKHYYRPSNAEILMKHAARFPEIRLFPVTDIAPDIAAAHKEFIGEGGVFDNIYKPKQ
jgi:sulfate/thiosulfate transport system substrate-binding protein